MKYLVVSAIWHQTGPYFKIYSCEEADDHIAKSPQRVLVHEIPKED